MIKKNTIFLVMLNPNLYTLAYPRFFLVIEINNSNSDLVLVNLTSKDKSYIPQNIKYSTNCKTLNAVNNPLQNQTIVKLDNIFEFNNLDNILIEDYFYNDCNCYDGCLSESDYDEIVEIINNDFVDFGNLNNMDSHKILNKPINDLVSIKNWKQSKKFINNSFLSKLKLKSN